MLCREVIDLFDQFRSPAFRYVLSFGIFVHDAEEVTQEAFLAVFRHLRTWMYRGNLRGWIFRVALNLALKRRSAIRGARDTTTDRSRPGHRPRPYYALPSRSRKIPVMTFKSLSSNTLLRRSPQ
jgi:RNA polymerase sigma-70 factor, ECF subfamily